VAKTRNTDRLNIIRIAGYVPCDPRTVEKYFRTDEGLKLVSEQAIKRALSALGIPDPRASHGGA
jgi:hypothetical protein